MIQSGSAPVTPAQMEIAPVAWFDGTFCPVESILIHPFAHALHYGTGVFEGIRAYESSDGRAGIFRLREHMERLLRSAAVYDLATPFDVDTLCDATVEVLRKNRILSAYIRPLIFFGEKTISLAPKFHCPTHSMILIRALAGYFGGVRGDGIGVTISKWKKFSSAALPATVKASGHYANSVLAMQDAVTRGFEEAILLNDRGEVAEGTGENVFVVKNGAIVTNDFTADALDGITRTTVIELARDRGYDVTVRPLSVDDLMGADEAFFTGTAAEVTPISHIDRHIYTSDRPITLALREAYLRAVRGEDPKHAAWVTFV
jgi:branched-chain amino acid aminotransferase